MEKVQTKAKLKSLRIAPRKVRLLIDLIRGMGVEQALDQLEVSKKIAAKPVAKLLKSAIANAITNHNLKKDSLFIVSAYVDGGATLHRWTQRAMGRATPIRKRTSHISLILEGAVDEKAAKKVKAKVTEKNKAEIKETRTEGNKVEEIKGEKV